MKILVTGAAGMLAAEVVPMLLTGGHEVIQTDINQRIPDIEALEVRDKAKVWDKIKKEKPDYVFHLAAETDVDLCEKDPDHAYIVNTLGTENIVVACKEFSSKLLYISTGAVFDGKKGIYDEFDNVNPVNIYGRSKLEGEKIVQDMLTEYFIIRAGWMVGGWDLDKKFVYKIVQQLKQGKKELVAVDDKKGTPTFTKDF
ncbi:MAG: SDR family oxidoreductase, partial [Candidatus Omnitrophota bacterium]